VRSRRPRLFYGWWIVLACGIIALWSWGLGFYALGVYLDALRTRHGWSTGMISAAFTVYYLVAGVGFVVVGGLIDRHGSRPVLAWGVVAMAASVAALGWIETPAQLFLVCLLLATAWPCVSTTAISGTLVPWFERRQGLATTLALTGASAGGIVLVPALVVLVAHVGFVAATALVAAAFVASALPLVAFVIRRRPEDLGLRPDGLEEAVPARQEAADRRDDLGPSSRRHALRTREFWTLAIAFSLVLLAQVGLVIHQFSLLEPVLGRGGAAWGISATTVAALVGRLAAGVIVDRVDQRTLSAVVFAVQAIALGALAWAPANPIVLYLGSAAFGLGVGNVITLPPLVVRGEFGAAAFGRVFGMVGAALQLGVALGPLVVGVLREVSGGYAAALWALAILDGAAIAVVLAGRRRPRLVP
jgi:sugar phosphate permease